MNGPDACVLHAGDDTGQYEWLALALVSIVILLALYVGLMFLRRQQKMGTDLSR